MVSKSTLTKANPLVYHVEDKLSFWEYFAYGLQQLLVMDSIFALPVILGTAFHLPPAEIAYLILIQASLIGAGISPSCGVRMTQTNEAWGGRPFNVDDKPRVRLGPGVFIEELENALKARGIDYKIIDVAPVLISPQITKLCKNF